MPVTLPLQQLPENCFAQIMLHFNLKERLGMSTVCTRWYHMMPYYDVIRLDLGQFTWKRWCMFDFEQRTHDSQWASTTKRYFMQPAVLRSILANFLGKLTNIRHLSLGSERKYLITGDVMEVIVDNMHAKHQLQTLDLGAKSFQDFSQVCQAIGQLSSLKELNLSHCVCYSENNVIISRAATLDLLAVYLTHALTQIETSLESVNLDSSRILPVITSQTIKTLILSNIGELTGEYLTQICSSCPNIDELSLAKCNAVHNFHCLHQLSHLRKLNLHSTNLRSAALSEIKDGCLKLEDLRITFCRLLDSFHALSCMPRLTVLHLGPTPNFDDENLVAITKNTPLKKLTIYGARQVSDDALSQAASQCGSSLEFANLGGCNLGDLGIQSVFLACPSLHEVYLNSNPITNSVLQTVGHCGLNLTTLNVESCAQLSAYGFQHLAEMRQRLLQAGATLPKLTIYAGGVCNNRLPTGKEPIFLEAKIQFIRKSAPPLPQMNAVRQSMPRYPTS